MIIVHLLQYLVLFATTLPIVSSVDGVNKLKKSLVSDWAINDEPFLFEDDGRGKLARIISVKDETVDNEVKVGLRSEIENKLESRTDFSNFSAAN